MQPKNLQEVIKIVKSANRSKTPIFPVSGGKNRGYEFINQSKIKTVFTKYRFEPNISLNLAIERAAYIVVAILYDKEVKGKDERAPKWYKETISCLKKDGIMPYRLTTKEMSFIHPDKDYASFVSSIKKTVDPNNILSPGRYDFTS